MANQQFDIGLATPARELPGIRMERFLRCPGACVLPAGHRLAVKDVIRPADLEGEPFISLALEDGVRHRIDRIFEDAGVHREMVIERSEEHTSELQSLMRISYAVFCLKKKNTQKSSTKYSTIQHE